MNQDFVLKGGAGNARALVKMAQFCKINLDPAIVELAATGYADLEDTPFGETERSIIQQMIDFDFRCVFPTKPNTAPAIIAHAAKVAGISPIFILSRTANKNWTVPFAKAGYKLDEDLFVLRPEQTKKTGLDNDFLRYRRQGLLIVDDLSATDVRYFAQDFPKTVYVTHRRLVTDLNEFVRVLFEGAPGDIMLRNALLKRRMETMGFDSQMQPMQFAFMFKIITDHLSDQEQENAPATLVHKPEPVVNFDEYDDLCF